MRTGPGDRGDAAYSVALPDGRSAWFFGDTFLGPIGSDGSRPSSAPLIHNSLVAQAERGDHLLRAWRRPHPPGSRAAGPSGDFYWPGAGLVEGQTLAMFVLGFRATGSGSWDFVNTGSAIALFSLPSLTLSSVIPVRSTRGVEWGTWVLDEGPFTYIYGVEDHGSSKYVHVARVPLDQLGGVWQYYGVAGWSDDPASSSRVLAGVSDDFSVVRVGSSYELVSQGSDDSRNIYGYAGASPTGPFIWTRLLYKTPDWGPGTFTYNALAHPELSDSRGLLISYNVNFANFADNYRHADVYRPHFIRVPASCFSGSQLPRLASAG